MQRVASYTIVAKRLDGWRRHLVRKYRPPRRLHCIRRVPSAPRKGHSTPPLLGPCLLWPRSPISATAELLFVTPCRKCFKCIIIIITVFMCQHKGIYSLILIIIIIINANYTSRLITHSEFVIWTALKAIPLHVRLAIYLTETELIVPIRSSISGTVWSLTGGNSTGVDNQDLHMHI